MAKLIKKPYTGRDKFNKTVIGMPESYGEATFDSTLEIPPYPSENWTLRISLRLFYRQVNPSEVTAEVYRNIAKTFGITVPAGTTPGMYPDADKNPSFIKNWSGNEWTNFMEIVKNQAKTWNGRFWLIPPDSFGYLDRDEGSWTAKSGKVTYRPNIKCEFEFFVAPSVSMAHGSADVVNLIPPDSFRSHSRLYNSKDGDIKNFNSPDATGRMVNTNQPTITHEIGHSLGLPHIGVSKNLEHCKLAVAMAGIMPNGTIPALYRGSKNAAVCYGDRGTAGDINNIMGSGSAFSAENAKPWHDRLFHHINLSVNEHVKALADFSKWKVSLSDTPAMSLVGFK